VLQRRIRRVFLFTAMLAAVVLIAAGCQTNDNSGGGSSGGGSSSGGKKIALLLPETKTARYESQDRPLFEAKVKELCPDCQILYSNADQDAAKQQNQADAALTNGANVLVLDPVDSASAASIVTKAKARNVPVLSYDRLINNAELAAYISYDNEQVGKLQATSLTDELKKQGKSGSLVMINGAPTDNNAKLFKKGAHSVLDSSGFKIAKEFDTPDWSPDKAQTEMEQSITALGKTGFVGVYAANDGTAGGAIAAMKGQGITPLPPVTGQDAELAGIQRILLGEQYMTVYKAIKPQAEQAAQIAIDLANGKPVDTALANQKVNNGKLDVPSVILTPVAVTKANVKDTVVKDEFVKPAELCAGPVAAACQAAGIST
jgi:D-xylose transport system substrate-binding protein